MTPIFEQVACDLRIAGDWFIRPRAGASHGWRLGCLTTKSIG
jgi:hypothetical protein